MISRSSAPRLVTAGLASAVLLAFVLPSGSPVHAKGRGRSLEGTWFMKVPAGTTHFFTFDKHGAVSGTISNGFGGLPRAGRAKSSDNGMWRRVGHRFEVAVWRFLYDVGTGDAVAITRIRFFVDLDRSRTTASGEFFVTQWMCPDGGLDCPDPNVSEPTTPEFAPPANTFTMTRASLD